MLQQESPLHTQPYEKPKDQRRKPLYPTMLLYSLCTRHRLVLTEEHEDHTKVRPPSQQHDCTELRWPTKRQPGFSGTAGLHIKDDWLVAS
jgi:hypothetical protein